ncbi:MAG: flippase [Lachnospiraceae bacterium]|nr:flippase [Lachnospiraceae bacterium]
MSKVKVNIAYNVGYQILLYIIPLITTPFLSRVIGAKGIGTYSYHYSIAYYFVIFAMLGLNNYGSRSIAGVKEDREQLAKTFWSIFWMQFMMSAIAISGYAIYCMFLSDTKVYSLMMGIYVVSALFDINWFFFGIEKFRITVTRNTVIKVVSLICIFIFVKEPDDVYIYILIMVISILSSQLVLWVFLFQYVSFRKVERSDVMEHLKPNFVLFIPVIAVNVYKMMDKIMLGMLVDYTEVGYYENCEKILNVPTSIISGIGTVMLPRITNLISSCDVKTENKYFTYIMLFSAFFSSAMCFGMMGIAEEFVPWFFGPGFENCVSIITVIFPSSLFLALANVLRTQILIPYKMDLIYVLSVTLGAVVNFIFNFIFISEYHALGASFATVLAEGTVFIVQFMFVTKRRGPIKIMKYLVPFYIFGIMLFLILKQITFGAEVENFTRMIWKILIGMAVYLAVSAFYYKRYLKVRLLCQREN